MNGFKVFKKLIIPALLVILSLNLYTFIKEKNPDAQKGGVNYFQKEFRKFIKHPALASSIGAYFQRELKKEKSRDIRPGESAALFFADLVLSLACLWLSLLLAAGFKLFSAKQYLWFLFMLNLSWFILFAIFKGIWEVLNFLVIRLEPDLAAVTLHNFSLAVIITSSVVYIWLIARTFGLNFFASLKVALSLHLIYAVVILSIVGFVKPQEKRWLKLVEENFGLRAVADCYISDIRKITSKMPLLSLIRIRTFHL